MTDYYKKVDKWVKEYKNYKPVKSHTLSSISDYIVWLYKWKKITNREKDDLCNRVTELFKNYDFYD